MGELVAAIDIGTSKICIAYGYTYHNKKLIVKDIAMENCNGLRKGVIIDTEMTSMTIKKVVSVLEERNNIKLGSVYANITGGHIRILNSSQTMQIDQKSREVSKEDIKKTLALEGYFCEALL